MPSYSVSEQPCLEPFIHPSSLLSIFPLLEVQSENSSKSKSFWFRLGCTGDCKHDGFWKTNVTNYIMWFIHVKMIRGSNAVRIINLPLSECCKFNLIHSHWLMLHSDHLVSRSSPDDIFQIKPSSHLWHWYCSEHRDRKKDEWKYCFKLGLG